MKLILRKSVPSLGTAGDIVVVKPGYGRNYLVPQGLAYPATARHLARIEEERERAATRARRNRLEAQRRASLLETLSIRFLERAGKEDRLFGSVTAADIASRVDEADLGFRLDKRLIDLDEPIKRLGVYDVPVNLHPEIEAAVRVTVEALDL